MTLIIPMSGEGKRFVNAGYTKLKPTINVDGRPIISHVLDLFPKEKDVIFICLQQHLEKTNLKSVLMTACPFARILTVTKTNKRGPVIDIMKISNYISDEKEVVVSYCDFAGKWDYLDFKKQVEQSNVQGAIPSYIGFHPHMLGPNLYGHMRVDNNNFLIEIKEKESFTDDKMNEYSAAGIYWFKTGKLMKELFNEAIKLNLLTGDEFFCSMPYNLLTKRNSKTLVYEMKHFCQWGTAEDLEEYEAWSRAFAQLSSATKKKGITDIPESRESYVKHRNTSSENLIKSFAYWESLFRNAPWHPYGKE